MAEDKNQNNSEDNSVMYNYSVEMGALEEENRFLRETINHLRQELDRLNTPPLMVSEVSDVHDNHAIIKIPNGNKFFVAASSNVTDLKTGDTILCDQKNLTIQRKIGADKKFNVEQFVIMEKPKVSFDDIGGLDEQIQEVKEVIELPLKKPELFKKMGVTPPKGVLLYGSPGTGKTLLAKAVAKSTNSTFIEIVGSELVQKFIGEGAKLVKEVFALAREKSPAIIFIDELDSLCAKRIEVGTSGEREVQRTFMQFLAEIDGFKPLGDIKIIGCTNRLDILDDAVIRPGRLDRLIEVPSADVEGIKKIFEIHTRNMKLDKKINLDKIFKKMDGFSGAEVKAVVTEAGYFAIRESRSKVFEKDLIKAINKVRKHSDEEGKDYMRMFN